MKKHLAREGHHSKEGLAAHFQNPRIGASTLEAVCSYPRMHKKCLANDSI